MSLGQEAGWKWAHRDQKPESFFNAWHAVLYSGSGAASLWVVQRNQGAGLPGRAAVPAGHATRRSGRRRLKSRFPNRNLRSSDQIPRL